MWGLLEEKLRLSSVNLHTIMSACPRRITSRVLRSHLLRPVLDLSRHQLTQTIHPTLSVAPSLGYSSSRQGQRTHRPFSTTRFQSQQGRVEDLIEILPICCPGCGAFAQTVEPNEPGFYSENRKQTRKLLASKKDGFEPENTQLETWARISTIRDEILNSSGHQDQPFELTAPRPVHGKSVCADRLL